MILLIYGEICAVDTRKKRLRSFDTPNVSFDKMTLKNVCQIDEKERQIY